MADAGRVPSPDDEQREASKALSDFGKRLRQPHCEDDLYGPCGCPDE